MSASLAREILCASAACSGASRRPLNFTVSRHLGMRTTTALFVSFLPLALGFVALFFLAWCCDRTARRVAPDLVSRRGPFGPSRAQVGFSGWVRFLLEQALGVSLLFAFIFGRPLIAYAALAVLTGALAYYAYTLRIRPLIQKGATRPETLALLSLLFVWVVSWGWFLGRFAGRARGAV